MGCGQDWTNVRMLFTQLDDLIELSYEVAAQAGLFLLVMFDDVL